MSSSETSRAIFVGTHSKLLLASIFPCTSAVFYFDDHKLALETLPLWSQSPQPVPTPTSRMLCLDFHFFPKLESEMGDQALGI